jgi:hypothetical protein
VLEGKINMAESLNSVDDIDAMLAAIEENKCHEAYPMPIDMQAFKLEFATLMATLEKATENLEEIADMFRGIFENISV